MRDHILLTIVALVLVAGPASARTWYVKPDSTGDVPTISVAVDSAAAQGDTVLLADGTFTGEGNREVDCLDKAVTIVSESGNPEACIIDGGGWSFVPKTAFRFRESSYGTARLEGVMITGFCQGVICDTSSCPEITDCIFQENVCLGAEIGPGGAGVRCLENSCPTFTGCKFIENSAGFGGGIECRDTRLTIINSSFVENGGDVGGGIGGTGSLVVVDCLFEGNRTGGAPMGMRLGGALSWVGSADLADCVFRDNVCWMGQGGALHYEGGGESDYLALTRCVFDGNCSGDEGAAVAVISYWSEGNAGVSISRCTFVGNGVCEYGLGGSTLCLATTGDMAIENTLIAYGTAGGALCLSTVTPSLRCCNIYGNAGGDWEGTVESQLGINGNISADALFCDTLAGDYRLETCSPCLPGNHPDGYDCGVPIGAYCSGCACKTATVPTTWGAIKAMYR